MIDATCSDCGKPHEVVRPGKTQPTCECAEYCTFGCGTKRQHYAVGEISKNMGGLLCPVCDKDLQ